MPRADVQIENFDLVNDLRNYYHNCVLTYEGKPAYVCEIYQGEQRNHAMARIRTLPESGDWSDDIHVNFSDLDVTVPRLGWVRTGGHWYYLSRSPQRRMRKGYNQELVRWNSPSPESFRGIEVTNREVVRQVWYGNSSRINPDVIIHQNQIYYEQDVVANIDAEGNLILVPGKEKLGEFVCKLLASNWDSISSAYSIRTLPSSLQTPLE